jgi:hypothetical protein
MKNLIEKIILTIRRIFIPNYAKYKRPFLISFLHSIFLTLLTLWGINIPFVMPNEYALMSEIMHINSFFEAKNDSAITNKYLLIDVSNNRMLRFRNNDSDLNESIADRKKLADLFHILNAHSDKVSYVICDLSFDEPVDMALDSALGFEMKQMDAKHKLIVPIEYNEKEKKFASLIYPVNHAIAQYDPSFNQTFYQYELIDKNGNKQIPLKVYEHLTNQNAQTFFTPLNLLSINGRLGLISIIPQFKYHTEDIKADRDYFYLGEFIPALIGNKPRIVVIGEFEKDDIHSILLGKMSGSLILINILEELEKGSHLLTTPYLILLLFAYFIISYNTFYRSKKKRIEQTSRLHTQNLIFLLFAYSFEYVKNWIDNNRNLFFLFILMIVSMLFFNHYIYFLMILFYLLIVEFIIELYHWVKEIKQKMVFNKNRRES